MFPHNLFFINFILCDFANFSFIVYCHKQLQRKWKTFSNIFWHRQQNDEKNLTEYKKTFSYFWFKESVKGFIVSTSFGTETKKVLSHLHAMLTFLFQTFTAKTASLICIKTIVHIHFIRWEAFVNDLTMITLKFTRHLMLVELWQRFNKQTKLFHTELMKVDDKRFVKKTFEWSHKKLKGVIRNPKVRMASAQNFRKLSTAVPLKKSSNLPLRQLETIVLQQLI